MNKWGKEIRERFRMTDKRYTLELCLNRGSYGTGKHEVLTSALYASFGPSGKEDHPRIRTSMFLTNTDPDLENVRMVMTHTGVTLDFSQTTIDNIHKDERDRLHALLQELRGVRYQYTRDIFGFLKKDGLDVAQHFKLTFPATVGIA